MIIALMVVNDRGITDGYKVAKVDLDEQQMLVTGYKVIRSMPKFIMFEGGEPSSTQWKCRQERTSSLCCAEPRKEKQGKHEDNSTHREHSLHT